MIEALKKMKHINARFPFMTVAKLNCFSMKKLNFKKKIKMREKQAEER